jgi:hypothetical protein
MPKLKDFYTKLKEQGKISNPDFDAFITALPEVDVPDSVVKSFEDSFFTLERAAAHKDIHGKIKREVLDPVDNELADLFNQLDGHLDPLLKAELKESGNSYAKLKSLKKLVPEIIEKVKGKPDTDEATKNKLLTYEKTVQELTEKFTKAEKTYNDQLTAQKAESEKQFHDFRLDTELQNLGNKFTLAEAYEQNRDAITKVLMSDIRSSNDLRLGEKDGRPEILVYDKESGKPKFNGNTPVAITSLLEEKYKPFLKQSGGSTGSQDRQHQQQSPNPPKPGVRTGARTTVFQQD